MATPQHVSAMSAESSTTITDALRSLTPQDAAACATRRLRAGIASNAAVADLLAVHAAAASRFATDVAAGATRCRPTPLVAPNAAEGPVTGAVGPLFHQAAIAVADSLTRSADAHAALATTITTKVDKALRSFVHTDPFWCRARDHENALQRAAKDYDIAQRRATKLHSRFPPSDARVIAADAQLTAAKDAWYTASEPVFSRMQTMDEARIAFVRSILIDYHNAATDTLRVCLAALDIGLRPRIDALDPIQDISLFCSGATIAPPISPRTGSIDVSPTERFATTAIPTTGSPTTDTMPPLATLSSKIPVNGDTNNRLKVDGHGPSPLPALTFVAPPPASLSSTAGLNKSTSTNILRTVTKKLGSAMSLTSRGDDKTTHKEDNTTHKDDSIPVTDSVVASTGGNNNQATVVASSTNDRMDDGMVSTTATTTASRKNGRGRSGHSSRDHSPDRTSSRKRQSSSNKAIRIGDGDAIRPTVLVDSEGYSIRPKDADLPPWRDTRSPSRNSSEQRGRIVLNIKPAHLNFADEHGTTPEMMASMLSRVMGGAGLMSPSALSNAASPFSRSFAATSMNPGEPLGPVGSDVIAVSIHEKMSCVIRSSTAEMLLITGEICVSFAQDLIARARIVSNYPIELHLSIPVMENENSNFSQIALAQKDRFAGAAEIISASQHSATIRVDVAEMLKWMSTLPGADEPGKRFTLATYQMSPRNVSKNTAAPTDGLHTVSNALTALIPFMITPIWKRGTDGVLSLMVLIHKFPSSSRNSLPRSSQIRELGIEILRVQCLLSIPGNSKLIDPQLKPTNGTWDENTRQLVWTPQEKIVLDRNHLESKFLCKATVAEDVSPSIVLVDWTCHGDTFSPIDVSISSTGDSPIAEFPYKLAITRMLSSGKYGTLG